jgi:ABC-2 type transport system permease protein
MESVRRIINLIKKEFIQIFRDKSLLPIVIIMPVFQLFLFGYALSQDVRNLPVAVIDHDKSRESRELYRKIDVTSTFNILYYPDNLNEGEAMMDRGEVSMILMIPPDFSTEVNSINKSAKVQVILDGSDSNSSIIAMNVVRSLLSKYSLQFVEERAGLMGLQSGSIGSVDTRVRVWFNEDLKSVNYMIPAVISLIITLITQLLTSMSIVKERERGTLEQLIVTPLRTYELILGKTVPSIVISYIDVVLIIVIGAWWFAVPIVGSVGLLLFVSLFYLLSTLGIGMFISTISRTQQQAMMSSFFTMVFNIVLSGFMIPIENMPKVLQYISYVVPLRYFLVMVRGIFMKGSDLNELWDELIALFVFGIVIFTISSLRFKRKLA